jgi:hypothetical protein
MKEKEKERVPLRWMGDEKQIQLRGSYGRIRFHHAKEWQSIDHPNKAGRAIVKQ